MNNLLIGLEPFVALGAGRHSIYSEEVKKAIAIVSLTTSCALVRLKRNLIEQSMCIA
jgi:hypothetical protein